MHYCYGVMSTILTRRDVPVLTEIEKHNNKRANGRAAVLFLFSNMI